MAAWRYEISLFVLKKHFTRHPKRKFVSPRGQVIYSINSQTVLIQSVGFFRLDFRCSQSGFWTKLISGAATA